MKGGAAWLALLVGYPVAFVVVTRWVPVVRERRWRWFASHQAAMAAVVTGWLLRGRGSSAALNGAWLVVATAWYVLGANRPTSA